ncbi:MAG: hypothetical protein ACLGIK_14020 [Gemmatimonadota bacterium]
MKLTDAIEAFIADKRSEGRINSPRTEAGYRLTLETHARDVGNRDPSTIGRDDVKRTLRRWEHPNTQAYIEFDRSELLAALEHRRAA